MMRARTKGCFVKAKVSRGEGRPRLTRKDGPYSAPDSRRPGLPMSCASRAAVGLRALGCGPFLRPSGPGPAPPMAALRRSGKASGVQPKAGTYRRQVQAALRVVGRHAVVVEGRRAITCTAGDHPGDAREHPPSGLASRSLTRMRMEELGRSMRVGRSSRWSARCRCLRPVGAEDDVDGSASLPVRSATSVPGHQGGARLRADGGQQHAGQDGGDQRRRRAMEFDWSRQMTSSRWTPSRRRL